MPKRKEAIDLVARLERGESLTSSELKRLRDAIKPKLGRRTRVPLKTVQDEFGRAIVFAMARAAGQSYDGARETSAARNFTSVSSVTRSFAWLKKTTGIDRADLEDAIKQDSDYAERIARGGMAALSPREILTLGAVSAGNGALEAEFSEEERAALFLDGSVGGTSVETLERTYDALRELLRVTIEDGRPFPAQSWADFALLVQSIAEPIAREIASRIRGPLIRTDI